METRSTHKDDPMELCRTCMTGSRKKRKLVPIFTKLEDTFIANIITDCTGVQINENDPLPTGICIDCFETVKLLACFIEATRESDSKLRRICKVEPIQDGVETNADPAHFLEIKCEPSEQMVDETAEDPDFDNDNDSDWKGSDEEVERSEKRKKLGLKSKPKPRRQNKREKKNQRQRELRALAKSEMSMELNEEEQQLFTVIEIPPNSHTCCGCLQIFKSAEELETHRKTTHVWKNSRLMRTSSKHECDGCLRRSYDTPEALTRHKELTKMLEVIWECKKCKGRFKMAGNRRKHVKLHAEGMPEAMVVRFKETTLQEFRWMCCAVKCGQSYTTEKDLVAHAQASHWADKQKADRESAEKPEQCQICFRRFSYKKQVAWHQRKQYYKRNNFQCALCGVKFNYTYELQAHETKEHNSKEFQCKICDKVLTTKSSLLNHMEVVHNNTIGKPHQCTICGKQFKQKGNLGIHLASHANPDFNCEVCPKKFTSKHRLQLHMRTHTGEKPYKCRICDHAFADSTNRMRHEMTHTGDKPYKCSYCEKSFILRRTLKEHESTHTHAQSVVPNSPKVRVQKKSTQVNLEPPEHRNEDSSNDYNYQQALAMVNRPATIRVTVPTVAAQSANTFHQTALQLAPVATTATTSNAGIQSGTILTYNVVPSTSANYGYILKF